MTGVWKWNRPKETQDRASYELSSEHAINLMRPNSINDFDHQAASFRTVISPVVKLICDQKK
jgi:hypothetical protein